MDTQSASSVASQLVVICAELKAIRRELERLGAMFRTEWVTEIVTEMQNPTTHGARWANFRDNRSMLTWYSMGIGMWRIYTLLNDAAPESAALDPTQHSSNLLYICSNWVDLEVSSSNALDRDVYEVNHRVSKLIPALRDPIEEYNLRLKTDIDAMDDGIIETVTGRTKAQWASAILMASEIRLACTDHTTTASHGYHTALIGF